MNGIIDEKSEKPKMNGIHNNNDRHRDDSKKPPEIFIFPQDNLEVRFTELKNILSSYHGDNGTLLARDVRSRWTAYLETFVECSGWLAVWNSKEHGSNNVTNKVVDVVDINFVDLEASVEVLDNDNLIEDNEVMVPLIQLYPIKNQSKEFNILTTATCLDQLRFFYLNLWKPWDVNDEESQDWVEEHLENRIHLLTLEPNDVTRLTLERLALESAHNQTLLRQLDNDDDESHVDNDDNNDDDDDEAIVERYELDLREESIRREVEILENPTLRLAKLRLDAKRKLETHPDGKQIFLVGAKNLSEINEMFKAAIVFDESCTSETPLAVYDSFQQALSFADRQDIIVLHSGKHAINSIEDMRKGGKIIGFVQDSSSSEVFVCPDRFNSSTLMEFDHGSSTMLANLTIQSSNSTQETIVVSKGAVVEMQSCRIVGGLVGIFVDGGELNMSRCIVTGCETGVEIGNVGGILRMRDTKVSHCQNGLMVDARSESTVLNNVQIIDNFKKDVFIHFASDSTDDLIEGDSSLLRSLPRLKDENSNSLGNVTIDPSSFYD